MRAIRPMWAVLALALLAMADGVAAEPLPKEECEKLKGEQSTLDQTGVKELFAKGPVWGRANLDRAKLRDIERYILVEEQLSFRCGLAKARLTLPFAEEDTPPAVPEEATDTKTEAPEPAPKPKPKPKPAAAPATGSDTKAAATTPPAKPKLAPAPAAEAKEPAAAPTKPAPKPKPKADDAYRPPAGANPAGDPFAKQIQPKTQ